MHLFSPIRNLFQQLTEVVENLTDEQYTRPSTTLSDATLGQHVRHILEHFIELDKGYTGGTVNYESRNRDHRIETDRAFTTQILLALPAMLDKADKPLALTTCPDAESDDQLRIRTNYYRELLFNLDHTVHHMALLRIGIAEVSGMSLPQTFGVAASTLKFRSVWVR